MKFRVPILLSLQLCWCYLFDLLFQIIVGCIPRLDNGLHLRIDIATSKEPDRQFLDFGVVLSPLL